MDRFRTALQLHKDQMGQSGTRPQASKAADGHALPPPIVYTRTRSLDIPLSVLRAAAGDGCVRQGAICRRL